MTPQPLAFRMPELRRLDEGRLGFFRRMADGVLASSKPGDLCWIREPFFLPTSFNGIRPTRALAEGAEPTFLDQVSYDLGAAGLGRLRMARELCRAWHRRHLRITAIEPQRIRDIDAADVEASGYADLHQFAAAWNRDTAMRGRGASWTDNPEVLRFEFELIDWPLPAAGAARPRKTKKDWRPSEAQIELRERTVRAFGSTVAQAFASSKKQEVVRIRDAVAWVLKETWPTLSFDQLGHLLDGKDHTIARIMVGRALKRRGEDPGFRLVTDDMTRESKPEPKPHKPRANQPRPSADAPLVHLPGVSKISGLASPANRRWCDQCQQLADHTRAAACGSPFCKVKPKELETA